MKSAFALPSALLTALLAVASPVAAQFAAGQSFVADGLAGEPSSAGAPDSGLYADGTRAINEGRWKDAESIFARVADEKSDHADGALYWKAYAQNKQGQKKPALDTCAELRNGFPHSRWLDECGALEIEIHSASGLPVENGVPQTDEMRLLELNAMLKKDEPRALAEIQLILDSDASPRLKDGAVFLLGQRPSAQFYPQVARISLVEGDVRIARGSENRHATGADWEKAVANTPLASGFSVVTGQGRAEIEFENASTLYLADNSVLLCNDLHTIDNIPFTELALLSGTVSLHVRPSTPGEVFIVKTPTDTLVSRYGDKVNLRLTSYLDGIGILPMGNGILHLGEFNENALAKGQNLYFRDSKLIAPPAGADPQQFAAFDQWVQQQIAKRTAANTAMMRDAGLSAPIPGLAEMNGYGKFFDCAPYGTCWEPNTDSGSEAATGSQSAGSSARAGQKAQKNSSGKDDQSDWDEFFPCFPGAVDYRMGINSFAAIATASYYPKYAYPYSWAVCHSGSWIHQGRHYVWVVGRRRHHHDPVRWVKSGRKVGFVPLHPADIKGRPAVNRTEVVFTVRDKNGLTVEPLRFDSGHEIEALQEPPREFRSDALLPLQRADEPLLMARSLDGKTAGTALVFDRKSESFVLAHQVQQGNKSVTVFAPVSNHGGNLQAHGGSFGGGSHSGSSGGGNSSRGGSGGGGSTVHTSSVSTTSSTTSTVSASSAGSSHH